MPTPIPPGKPQFPPPPQDPSPPPPQPAVESDGHDPILPASESGHPDLVGAEHETEWIAAKLKRANDEGLHWHLGLIWLAKQKCGDGWQNAVDQAMQKGNAK